MAPQDFHLIPRKQKHDSQIQRQSVQPQTFARWWINDLGFSNQTNDLGDIITCKKRIKAFNEIHLKYVDDLTIGEAIKMKEMLESVPVHARPQPDNFHARTGHVLPPANSKVYDQLSKISEYANTNGIRLNYKKTKLMLDGHHIDLVEETRLLGLVLRSDLSWSSNTDYIVQRCNSKLWFLRRLKKLGASMEDLLDLYHKHVRSILEYAAPVWHSSLTGEDRLKLERVQKTAFHIILGEQYKSYNSALKITGSKTLFDRRRKICLKFAQKSLKNSKFKNWFKPTSNETKTRQEKLKFHDVHCRADIFKNSPLSYLTGLLNHVNK